MKISVLLLFISTANLFLVVCSEKKDVEFPPKLLQPDLETIEYYFENIDSNILAVVRWNKAVAFLVQQYGLQNSKYLKVSGFFKVGIPPIWVSYNGLFFKKGQFYVYTGSKLNSISADNRVYYLHPDIPDLKKYLSIRYFGLEELRKMINPAVDSQAKSPDGSTSEGTFSAIAPKPEPEHFIEYFLGGAGYEATAGDGKLRVLIKTAETPQKVVLSNIVEAERLVFNQKNKDLAIPQEMNINSELGNVFGVRMARKGALAEVQNSIIKKFISATTDNSPINAEIV